MADFAGGVLQGLQQGLAISQAAKAREMQAQQQQMEMDKFNYQKQQDALQNQRADTVLGMQQERFQMEKDQAAQAAKEQQGLADAALKGGTPGAIDFLRSIGKVSEAEAIDKAVVEKNKAIVETQGLKSDQAYKQLQRTNLATGSLIMTLESLPKDQRESFYQEKIKPLYSQMTGEKLPDQYTGNEALVNREGAARLAMAKPESVVYQMDKDVNSINTKIQAYDKAIERLRSEGKDTKSLENEKSLAIQDQEVVKTQQAWMKDKISSQEQAVSNFQQRNQKTIDQLNMVSQYLSTVPNTGPSNKGLDDVALLTNLFKLQSNGEAMNVSDMDNAKKSAAILPEFARAILKAGQSGGGSVVLTPEERTRAFEMVKARSGDLQKRLTAAVDSEESKMLSSNLDPMANPFVAQKYSNAAKESVLSLPNLNQDQKQMYTKAVDQIQSLSIGTDDKRKAFYLLQSGRVPLEMLPKFMQKLQDASNQNRGK